MMEFSAPRTITAQYKITTPMFLGGEGQQADTQHFRNASFKGALRFWWRALNWGVALQEAHGNKAQALKDLHAREGRLFGLASDGKNSSQSLIHINSKMIQRLEFDDKAVATVGYLLGQGLYHFRNGVSRQYIAGGDITIQITAAPKISDVDLNSIRQALIALGIFGGLGSRARKGLGSIAIQTLQEGQGDKWSFTTVQAIKDFIQTIKFAADDNTPLSSFSSRSRIDISTTKKSGMDALRAINNEMQLYRSWGQNGKVNRETARRNFPSDHNNVLAATQGQELKNLPERAVFGLPHNYFFSSTNAKADINPSGEGRRASPLFIHIHALEGGQFAAIQTLLPGEFLPHGTTIDVKVKRTQQLKNPSVDFAVISKYLDGYQERQTLKQGQA